MNNSTVHVAQGSTASFSVHADTASTDLKALQAHLTYCKQPLCMAFMLKKSTQHLYGFLVTRIFSLVLLSFVLVDVLVHWL